MSPGYPRHAARPRALGSALAVLAVVAQGFIAVTCYAGWSANPAPIKIESTTIPLVQAVTDGGTGALVVWQAGNPGPLRMQHVLASGDLDPALPAAGVTIKSAMDYVDKGGMIPDRAGGFYLWFSDPNYLHITHIGSNGLVVPGWVDAHFLGDSQQPISLIEDGSHGFFSLASTSDWSVTHVNPDGSPAAGWPAGWPGPTVIPHTNQGLPLWPHMALAPGGDVYLAWAFFSFDTTVTPSCYRLLRLAAGGVPAAGWPAGGINAGPFRAQALFDNPQAPIEANQLDLAPDGRGGAFLLTADPDGLDSDNTTLDTRVFRFQGDGTPDPSWPAAGAKVGWADPNDDYGRDASIEIRVLGDGQDGAIVGVPLNYGSLPSMGFGRCSDGSCGGSEGSSLIDDVRMVPSGDGGIVVAFLVPEGSSAEIGVQRLLSSTGGSWYENGTGLQPYGDEAVSPTGDGGAMLFWSNWHSESYGPAGLYAIRLNGAGQVTSVASGPAALGLSILRFVPGAGVRAVLSAPGKARVDLFDVTGRRVTSQRFAARGEASVTLPGTAGLRSGLYFLRATSGHEGVVGRVVIAR